VIPLREAHPVGRTPWITLSLIAACGLVFAYELVVQATGGNAALNTCFEEHGVVPADVTGAIAAGEPTDPAWLDVPSSIFIHAGWIHLLGNMLYLWIFGGTIEARLGRVLFVVFFLAGGAAAALTQVWIDPDSEIPLVGASGAIAAILGAYLVLFPRARILSLVFLGFFYQLIEIPALVFLGFWIALQLIDGLASLGGGAAQGGVAFFAHIGGFFAGTAIGLVLRFVRPNRPGLRRAAA
jgi:membrane associated rhomboid family serine protease